MVFSTPTARRLTLPLLTGLTALLAACGSTGAPTPAPTPTPTPPPNPTPSPTAPEVAGRIPGKITPFTVGDASSVKPDELSISAGVSAQGTFDLALPKVATMVAKNDTLPVPGVFGLCQNTQTSAPSTLGVYPINDLNTDSGQNLISEIDPAKAALNYRAWWFSTQDATVKFKGDCVGLGKIDTTFALKRGWNLLITVTDPGVSTTYAASTQPTNDVPWQPSSALAAAKLNAAPNVLHPWRNLPEYRDR